MDERFWQWAVPLLIGVLGFVLGGGWPLKAYRRMGDLDLVERMKPHFWMRIEQGAYERENSMRHDRTEETQKMIHDGQRAVLQLTGAVERHTEALKFYGEELKEAKGDIEGLKNSLRPE